MIAQTQRAEVLAPESSSTAESKPLKLSCQAACCCNSQKTQEALLEDITFNGTPVDDASSEQRTA